MCSLKTVFNQPSAVGSCSQYKRSCGPPAPSMALEPGTQGSYLLLPPLVKKTSISDRLVHLTLLVLKCSVELHVVRNGFSLTWSWAEAPLGIPVMYVPDRHCSWFVLTALVPLFLATCNWLYFLKGLCAKTLLFNCCSKGAGIPRRSGRSA